MHAMPKTVYSLTHKLICRYVTVALAIAHYYWTRGNREVMPRFPVLHAIRTTLRCVVLKHTALQSCNSEAGTLPNHQCLEQQNVSGQRAFSSVIASAYIPK